MNQKIKNFNRALAAGLIFSILLSLCSFEAGCEDLRKNVLRLHIIANSDEDFDQSVKLSVRDAVLEECEDIFSDCGDLSSALAAANENLIRIQNAANAALCAAGSEDEACASLGLSRFDTRVYDDFTLPAGEYNALKIEIGEARGKNFWCVLFPSVCAGAAGSLEKTVSKSGESVAENGGKFIIRFKIIEIYERIRRAFCKE